MDLITHSDEWGQFMQEQEQLWQQTLADDPAYIEWLNSLEKQRAEDSGRRADALIEAGLNPF